MNRRTEAQMQHDIDRMHRVINRAHSEGDVEGVRVGRVWLRYFEAYRKDPANPPPQPTISERHYRE